MTDDKQPQPEKPKKTAKKPVKPQNTAMSDWLKQHPLIQTPRKRGRNPASQNQTLAVEADLNIDAEPTMLE